MMKRIHILLTLSIAVVLFACSGRKTVNPPVAEKIPHEIFDKRIDNYFWMRLSDEQKTDTTPDEQTLKVLNYLKGENEYAKAVMKHTDTLQKILYKEMVGRIKKDDESVPYLENGFYYYIKYSEGKEYPVHYRRKGSLDAPEEIILDENKLAEGQEFCSVGMLSVTRDGRLLAYSIDTVSRRQYDIYFIDLETGKQLPEKIDSVAGQMIWAADGKTLFYTGKDPETLREDKILRHKLGENIVKDDTVYLETDETFNVYLTETKSKKYIVIQSDQTLTTEARLIDAYKPDAPPIIFEPRKVNHEYQIDHLGGEFYIRTNSDGASNFKLMKTPEGKTAKKNWTDVIPHRSDVLFEGFELFDNYLVSSERIKGLSNLRIINTKDKSEHYLDFGEETYTAGININPNSNTDILRYSYTSLTTPSSIIDYNMKTKEKR
jgi:oligopeptidase B